MSKKITYADTGVDRELRAKSKRALRILKETYRFSLYGKLVQLPFGNIFPIGRNRYLDLVIEGIGTKVLVAQLAEKYDTIGIDGVAVAVNDVIRSGAKPLAVADNIHAHVSDPVLVKQWMKGIVKGATEAECIVPSGEIGDVPELIKGLMEGKGVDMVFAGIGEVTSEKTISGGNIKPSNVIVGLRSSGLHSNGISLARKILFEQWGGKYNPYDTPDGLDREIVYEVLEPTKIHVKPLLSVAEQVNVKAAVHITGDAYLKFDRLTKFSKNIGFEFNNFKPQSIFELIQKTAYELGGTITDEEMFKTFNMGWGFAIIVEKTDKDKAIDILEKTGTQAEEIGHVTDSEGINILYGDRKIILR
ncbi:MAG: phosphoribosylformylglycinamidine cyclo-ligase [Candidatus Bathyarchaeota archaeon]|nr:phosphoribosylformylglycinamidine cyclo-ligase [Candidatus Bathyarchaeota archaeon]MDH5746400.1 phosphoribosylformylglycinamidine cyclo-ligase [Candidatus Bathyarchaeota archaeon]